MVRMEEKPPPLVFVLPEKTNLFFINAKPPFERPHITLSFTTIHFSWISSSAKSKINDKGSISSKDFILSDFPDAEKKKENRSNENIAGLRHSHITLT